MEPPFVDFTLYYNNEFWKQLSDQFITSEIYSTNFYLVITIVFMSFQTEACKCNGWKNPNPPPTPARADVSQPLASLTDPCRSCNHTLGKFISTIKMLVVG